MTYEWIRNHPEVLALLERGNHNLGVLGFTDRGRDLLSCAKKQGTYLNAGQRSTHPYWQLEQRCGSLYGLFAADTPGSPAAESQARIYYKK
mgnify:CR=1 FL=1